jgi:hypothetical protein
MRISGYNINTNPPTPARPIPRSFLPSPNHETRLWKKATLQELFLEEVHRKDQIRNYTKILLSDKSITKDNRILFTSKPTNLYKSSNQIKQEQDNIMHEVKAARKVLRQKQEEERKLRAKQQQQRNLSNTTNDDAEEASVNP